MPRLVKRKITFIASNEGCDRYSGKEFYPLKGINIYDFHARTYAPDIARFMQPDPQADDYHWLSPYSFCGGDPINFVDPDGEKIYYIDMTGRLLSPDEALKANKQLFMKNNTFT